MKKKKFPFILFILFSAIGLFTSLFLGNAWIGTGIIVIGIALLLYLNRAAMLGTLANGYFQNGDHERALATYEKAIALPSCAPLTKIVYSYRLLYTGETTKAIDILNSLDQSTFNEEEKFNFDATYAVGLWKQGQLSQAITILEGVASKKESELVYETLGYLLLCAKDYKKALTFNEKAYEFASHNNAIKDNLATSYYYNRKDKSAAKLYKELITDSVTFPEPYYFYGLLLNDKEKYETSLKYLNMALDKKESFLSELKKEHIEYMMDEIERYLQEVDSLENIDETQPSNA